MRTVLLAALLVLAPYAAAADEAPSVPAVLAELAASPEQPGEYKASVALHVRLRVFPFIRMTLHGDSWYKRPGLYRFVFRGVPLIARAFFDMKYDLGDPAHWPDRYEIAFAPQSTAAAPVLRLTPKSAVMVKQLDVALDPAPRRVPKAGLFARRRRQNPAGAAVYARLRARVRGQQSATINLPRMKAEL